MARIYLILDSNDLVLHPERDAFVISKPIVLTSLETMKTFMGTFMLDVFEENVRYVYAKDPAVVAVLDRQAELIQNIGKTPTSRSISLFTEED